MKKKNRRIIRLGIAHERTCCGFNHVLLLLLLLFVRPVLRLHIDSADRKTNSVMIFKRVYYYFFIFPFSSLGRHSVGAKTSGKDPKKRENPRETQVVYATRVFTVFVLLIIKNCELFGNESLDFTRTSSRCSARTRTKSIF